MLDQYYATEKPLPLDPKERYRMTAAVGKLERAAVDYVVKRYFTQEGDGWHQKRTDEEIAAYRTRAESARENGQRGGRPSNRIQTDSVIPGLAKQTESKANQEPVTSNQEPVSKTKAPRTRATQLPPDFGVSDRVREWAADKGYDRLEQRLEHFRDKAKQKGYANHDWDLAFMNAIREGWAKPDSISASGSGLSAAGEATKQNIDRWIAGEEAKDAAH